MSAEATDTKPVATTQKGRRWWLFAASVLVSLTNELSTAVTNLSLGPMRRDLDASSAVMQMAVTLGKLILGVSRGNLTRTLTNDYNDCELRISATPASEPTIRQ
jgi:hypothetical protein